MGFGRFGPGGCCLCSDDPTDPDPGGSTEAAGPCGWCGYYGATENDLEMPVPASKLCFQQVTDNFAYSKDYPRVPYWTFQRDLKIDPWEAWLFGDLNHLGQGNYLTSSRDRYSPSTPSPWRNFPNRLVDTLYCSANTADGVATNSWTHNLRNLPPAYGNIYAGYPYVRRFENGVIVNSPTNKTDLIPLVERMSLQFNTPSNQFPKYLWVYSEGPSPLTSRICFEEPCPPQVFQAASQIASFSGIVDGGVNQCATPRANLAFGWNVPGSPGFGFYGLWIQRFTVESTLNVPISNLTAGPRQVLTEPYLPNQQYVTIQYWIGDQSGLGGTNEGDGYRYFPVFYKDNFTLSVQVEFDTYHPDNRKCVLTVTFLMDTLPLFSQTHVIAKPGWRQDGSPTDEQAFIQKFCPSQVDANNQIRGVNFGLGSAGASPWWYELVAMWDSTQTPRESFWMDNWLVEYARL